MLQTTESSRVTYHAALSHMPVDILRVIAEYSNLCTLAALAASNSISRARLQPILWKRLVKLQDDGKLRRYFSVPNRWYSPDVFTAIYYPEAEDVTAAWPRFLSDDELNFLIYQCDEKKSFLFSTFLHSPRKLLRQYLKESGFIDSKDEQGLTLRALMCAPRSVLQQLTLGRFSPDIFARLNHLIKQKIIIPVVFKQRQDFRHLVDYFQYLSSNVHDLFITLSAYPDLINQVDESGRTLLFYFRFSQQTPWLLPILTSVNVAVNVNHKCHEGNTFLHVVMHNYAIADPSEEYITLIQFAKRHGFKFDNTNAKGETILHLVSQTAHNLIDILLSIIPVQELNPNHMSLDKRSALDYAFDYLNICMQNQNPPVNWFNIDAIASLATITNIVPMPYYIIQLQRCIYTHSNSLIKKIASSKSWYTLNINIQLFLQLKALLALYQRLVAIAKLIPSNQHIRSSNLAHTDKAQSISFDHFFVYDIDTADYAKMSLIFTSIRTGLILWIYSGDNPNEKGVFQLRDAAGQALQDFEGTLSDLKLALEDLIIRCHPEKFILDAEVSNLPVYDEDDITRLLDACLLRLRKEELNAAALTQRLGDYFNNLTERFELKICNKAFEYLLTKRVQAPKNTRMWQSSVIDGVHWPNLIDMIRTHALDRLMTTCHDMRGPQAIELLTECREFSLFNQTNGYAEMLGRTYAVVAIDNLIARFEQDKSKANAVKPSSG